MFQQKLATLIQAGGYAHLIPTGTYSNPADALTSDLLTHVIARGDQRVLDVLAEVRSILDESGRDNGIACEAIDEIIQSGLLLALLEIEDNANVYAGSAAALLQHSTVRIAAKIAARTLITDAGVIRLGMIGGLRQLGFRCKGVRFPSGLDGLYISTEKGDVFVSEYSQLNWFD